jgi:hypothetical protein
VSDEPRVKRPALDRKDPIRSFASFFAPPGAPGPAPSDEPSEAVSSAVDLGYRVVNEYIRQGEDAARRAADPLRAAPFANDVRDLSARMFQYASDFAGAWFEMLGLTSTGEASRTPFPFAGFAAPRAPAEPPAPQPEPAAAPARTQVAVEVCSARPAIVTVDLRPGAAERPLVVHELRAPSPDLPRLSDVAFVAGRFRVRVPDGHPAGVYSGAVIDLETSVPAGTVCVILE